MGGRDQTRGGLDLAVSGRWAQEQNAQGKWVAKVEDFGLICGPFPGDDASADLLVA